MTSRSNAESKSPFRFFVFVFLLSLPFMLVGTVTHLQLMPGLPVSSLMIFCPMIAASILVYRERGTIRAVADLLKRSFDCKRIRAKVWYVPIVLVMPGIAVLAYAVMRLFKRPLPLNLQLPGLAAAGGILIVAFVAALGEEIGWMGYAAERMHDKWNALQAAILLGAVWALWHVVLFVQAGRSPIWIAWQCLNIIASRILLVWLYNNTGGSLFGIALCHATMNVSWQLFPNHGSHYDPQITALIALSVAVFVTMVWGPRTLVGDRKIRQREP